MSIVITLLLSLLPQLLEWIFSLFGKGKMLSGRQLDQVNRITWYADQIRQNAPKVGCAVGGVKPEVEAANGLDLAKYRAVIDHAIGLFEGYAKLTGETWDDQIAATVRMLFDRLVPGLGMVAAEDPEPLAAAHELPAWLLPLVMEVAKWLFSRR